MAWHIPSELQYFKFTTLGGVLIMGRTTFDSIGGKPLPAWSAKAQAAIDSAGQAQEVHAAIRAQIAGANAKVADGLQILYGGSVKPGNAEELFGMPDIDGGLIGGASLVAADFLAICRAAVK